MKRAVQTTIFLLCVVFSIAAVVNVMSDNAEVEALAVVAACADQGAACHPQKTRMERTPLAQSFELVTPKRTVEVRCARTLVLVGDYACTVR
ncbi:MAG: hypothetical protein ABJE95_11250 [Byssovorax sp.]